MGESPSRLRRLPSWLESMQNMGYGLRAAQCAVGPGSPPPWGWGGSHGELGAQWPAPRRILAPRMIQQGASWGPISDAIQGLQDGGIQGGGRVDRHTRRPDAGLPAVKPAASQCLLRGFHLWPLQIWGGGGGQQVTRQASAPLENVPPHSRNRPCPLSGRVMEQQSKMGSPVTRLCHGSAVGPQTSDVSLSLSGLGNGVN